MMKLLEVIKIIEYPENNKYVYFAYTIGNINKIFQFNTEYRYFVGDYMSMDIDDSWKQILKIEDNGRLIFLLKSDVENFKIKTEKFINGDYFKIIQENRIPKIMSNVTFYSPKDKREFTGILKGKEITTITNSKNENYISKGFLEIEVHHSCGIKELFKTATWIS